ncbi:hypothetical protein MKW94_000519 [Papaver nudicaule]|uniref:Auxin-responsive protein n=1 Tax=Papaver nudicaule TaxID=74823 RepID=A0AA41SBF5_PAPNU|nr:hypothetical protein [Papaver nudicaule]
MSTPLEHDYIGLSCIKTEDSEKKKKNVMNMKETELRLGLPGSESPERNNNDGGEKTKLYPLELLKSFGGKRGFSEAIDGSSKWGSFGNNGSEVDLVVKRENGLFSPRSGGAGAGKTLGVVDNNNCNNNNTSTTQQQCGGGGGGCSAAVKPEVVPCTPKPLQEKKTQLDHAPPSKAQVVGWPPIRSFRKNTMATNPSKNNDDAEGKSGSGCLYVKVSMDGAPYLRKVDLKMYSNYIDLSSALEKMFSCFTIGQCSSNGVQGQDGLTESRLRDLLHGSECVLTYEDKDGDWMLVGDVPWDMFTDSCKRLRIMKGSEAIGLAAPRAMEKCKNKN